MFLHSPGAFFFWDDFLRFRCRCKLRGVTLSLASCRAVLPCVLNGLLMVGVHLAGFVTLRIREVHTNLTRHVVVRDGIAVGVVRHTEQGARERPVANGNQAGTGAATGSYPRFPARCSRRKSGTDAQCRRQSRAQCPRGCNPPSGAPTKRCRFARRKSCSCALRPQLLDTACVPVNLLCG